MLSLSRIKRWGGHGKSVCTVAEHSVRVGRVHGFPGLMHDAHEFILGDMITPIKKLLPNYRVLCDILQAKIEKYYNIKKVDCKITDREVAIWEYERYYINGRKPWSEKKSFKRFMETARRYPENSAEPLGFAKRRVGLTRFWP